MHIQIGCSWASQVRWLSLKFPASFGQGKWPAFQGASCSPRCHGSLASHRLTSSIWIILWHRVPGPAPFQLSLEVTLELLGGLAFGHLWPEPRSGLSEPAQLLKRGRFIERRSGTAAPLLCQNCMAEQLDWLDQLLEQEVSLEPCFLLFR